VVFRLLTFFVSIVGFAALVWFGVTVELGDRTLVGHLRAIGQTKEAKNLWDGTKDKVTDLVGIEAARRAEAAKEAFKNPPEKTAAEGPGPATERAPVEQAAAPADKPAAPAPAKAAPASKKPAPAKAAAPVKKPAALVKATAHKGKAPGKAAGKNAPASKGKAPKSAQHAQATAHKPK
jgi:hypothetical protein